MHKRYQRKIKPFSERRHPGSLRIGNTGLVEEIWVDVSYQLQIAPGGVHMPGIRL